MREWFSPAEIAEARSPELPGSVRNINKLAKGWRSDPAKARREAKGGGWLYHVSLLPPGAQARLQLLHAGAAPAETPREDASTTLWARYEGLSEKQKAECRRRLDCLVALDALAEAGATETAAAATVAARFGVSRATVFNWKKAVRGVRRADRLAALAPGHVATAAFADCHPAFWDVVTSDWLRPEKPTLSSCYRRARKAASKNGWLPIPSERALRRRIEAEIPAGVVTLARSGARRAKTLYPAQKRTRAALHAMQAVNMDGHELDVFVKLGDGTVTRMHLLTLQDLYSGKIVAWRLSETENKETVRLVIGDMVELYGIPEKIVLDNGRAFTSKWISGQTQNRFRFKIREDDPKGLLTALGVDIHWAKPYSGQSKPIERAFRDLADNIAKHPFCAGAYTGSRPEAKPENYGARAVPAEAFGEHVAREIDEHNSRESRRLETCAGRSFDETFAASLADPATIVTMPTDAQRALWMLTAEKVRAQKGSGEIHFMDNRYWSAALTEHAGEKLVIRFDPGYLHSAIRAYTLDDRFICVAECVAATGFFDAAAARVHERNRAAFLKSIREHDRLLNKISAAKLADLYGAGAPAAEPARPQRPAVTRVATGGSASAAAPARMAAPDTDFEEKFAAGLRAYQAQQGDADILPFTPKRSDHG